MSWNRKLWGVEFTGSDDRAMILGRAWLNPGVKYYEGEPSRALLFQTRDDARRWCKEQTDKNEGRTDCCAQWRFRPVRVVETVRKA